MNSFAPLPDEAELVGLAASDLAAFATIYDYYLPRLYKYMRYRVGDSADAEELTSQVFEQVLTKIGSYRPERGAFAGWLFAIAHNVVIDYRRVQKRRSRFSFAIPDDMACAATGPEETVLYNETRQKLLAVLSCLTDQDRNLISLKFSAGLNNRTIAEITGLTPGNVAVILYRAMRLLRTKWDNEEVSGA